MGRISEFLPSIGILFGIFVVSLALGLATTKHWVGLKSIKWRKENKKKEILLTFPLSLVLSTTSFVLFFQTPLIIIFDEISSGAWLGIIFSSTICALLAFFSGPSLSEIFSAKEKREIETDDIIEAEKILHEKGINGKPIRAILAFLVGVLVGFVGVQYQSIWLIVGLCLTITIVQVFLESLRPYLSKKISV